MAVENNPGEINTKSVQSAIACGAGIMFGPGPMIVAGLSLLMTAVSAQYGWNRTTFSAVPLVAAWAAALSAPFYGRAMDRFGLRRVLIPGVAVFGVSFLLLAIFARQSWHFFAGYFLIGLAAGSQGPVGYYKIVSQWFTAKRGLVMALLAAVGSGVGYAVAPQLINRTIEAYGWRVCYIGISLAILLISLPIMVFLLRERAPAPQLERRSTPSVVLEGLTRAEGLRKFGFWQLAIGLFLAANVFYGVLVHLFPMMLGRGLGRDMATVVVSVVALGAICGQLAAGVLLDRIHTPRIAVLFFAIGLCGVLAIHYGPNAAAAPGAAMLGFGQGAELSVVGYLVTRLFGLKAYGGLYSLIYAGAIAASGTGPLIMGITFDRFHSYGVMLTAFEIALAVAVVLVATLPAYAYGAERRSAAAAAIPGAEPIATP